MPTKTIKITVSEEMAKFIAEYGETFEGEDGPMDLDEAAVKLLQVAQIRVTALRRYATKVRRAKADPKGKAAVQFNAYAPRFIPGVEKERKALLDKARKVRAQLDPKKEKARAANLKKAAKAFKTFAEAKTGKAPKLTGEAHRAQTK